MEASKKPKAPKPPRPAEVSSEGPIKRAGSGNGEGVKSTLDLLGKAHDQLEKRKREVEEQLNGFNELQKELDMVNTQMESLKNTVTLFGAIENPVGLAAAEGEASEGVEKTESLKTDAELEFTGNKRDFVNVIVGSRGTEGITPKEVEALFSERQIVKGRNLIYNALSSFVKQGSMKRDEGRYFSVMPEKSRRKAIP